MISFAKPRMYLWSLWFHHQIVFTPSNRLLRALLLRMYPIPFAREFADMLEDLKATCKGKPATPEVIPSAITSYQKLECADPSVWQNAGLANVYNYLRKCKHLKIPNEWKHLIPKKLPEVSEGWAIWLNSGGLMISVDRVFRFRMRIFEKKKGFEFY